MSCHKTKEIYEEMCDYLGQDIDHPMCQILKKHVENCPDCKKYIDNIKKTVILFKEASIDKKVPQDKMYDIINKLKKIGKKNNG